MPGTARLDPVVDADRRWPALSLRARLTVVATALVAVALLAGTVLLLVALQRSLIAALDESARQRALDVAALVESGQLPNPIPVAVEVKEPVPMTFKRVAVAAAQPPDLHVIDYCVV